MAIRVEPADTDRSYRVVPCDHGIALYGQFASTDDTSALLKAWHFRGLRYASRDVATRLGALVAVTESVGDAERWIAEIDEAERGAQ